MAQESSDQNILIDATLDEGDLLSSQEDESSLDKGIVNEEEVIARIWSPYLYSLQKRAPKSRMLPVDQIVEITEDDTDAADLGIQYHGFISKADAIELLIDTKEGTYLVRKRSSGNYIVSFKYLNSVRHYSFKRHQSKFLYGDKEFNSIGELVDDSLIMLYLEQHDISKHLTLGRAKRNRVIRRRNVIKSKVTDEDTSDLIQQRRLKFAHNSSKSLETSDHVDGVYRELSTDMEPVKVVIEDEKGSGKLQRQKAHSEKIDRKKFHLRIKKKDGNMSINDRKSCPQEIVNLLSIYTTRPSSTDLTHNNNGMSHTKSTENLSEIKSTGAIGQLLKSTLSIHSDENLSKIDQERSPSPGSPKSPKSRTSSTSSYGKSHNLKVTTYTSLTWCDLCHHFLWGLVQQGAKCLDCGINVHKQCIAEANEMECIPKKEFVKRIFGIDLTTVVLLDEAMVPTFLKLVTGELELRGLQTEGIYRVPGRTSHVMDLKEKVDDGDVDFSLIPDIHVIGALIKLYLRELPIPLITFDAYSPLLKFIDQPNPDCMILKKLLLEHLPKAHFDTLHHILVHLTKVVKYSDTNKMQSSNLAVVFAPTIMRSPNSDNILLTDLPLQKKLVEYLINNCSSLFE